MRSLREIQSHYRISDAVPSTSGDGLTALINMPRWTGSIVISNGGGWEHVSVAPFKHKTTPSWEEMCSIKEMCFYDDEDVIQIHPKKADYINNIPNCLHLWRCKYKEMILPPSVFVGVRKGQTAEEVEAEIKVAYEKAGEVYEQ